MFREAFDIREMLDGHATELRPRANATAADKERLRDMLAECERLAAIPDRSTREQFEELQVGIDLHRVIAEIGGNEMLTACVRHPRQVPAICVDGTAVAR